MYVYVGALKQTHVCGKQLLKARNPDKNDPTLSRSYHNIWSATILPTQLWSTRSQILLVLLMLAAALQHYAQHTNFLCLSALCWCSAASALHYSLCGA